MPITSSTTTITAVYQCMPVRLPSICWSTVSSSSSTGSSSAGSAVSSAGASVAAASSAGASVAVTSSAAAVVSGTVSASAIGATASTSAISRQIRVLRMFFMGYSSLPFCRKRNPQARFCACGKRSRPRIRTARFPPVGLSTSGSKGPGNAHLSLAAPPAVEPIVFLQGDSVKHFSVNSIRNARGRAGFSAPRPPGRFSAIRRCIRRAAIIGIPR